MQEIFTLTEAGRLKKWGSRQTLSKACADGKLPFRKFGYSKLVHVSDLDAFVGQSKMLRNQPDGGLNHG